MFKTNSTKDLEILRVYVHVGYSLQYMYLGALCIACKCDNVCGPGLIYYSMI